ncbi:MAG: TetR/AcrR family transcriptional regulator [Acidimicrobiales bacterium]
MSSLGRHDEVGQRLPLRARKKLATRRSLQRVALELVAQRGYAHVTVEDIAEAADVSPRTFFNYFASKEAALLGVDPERAEVLRRRIAEQPASMSPIEVLESVLVDEVSTISRQLDDLGGDTAEWLRCMKEAQVDPDLVAARAAHLASLERALAAGLAERLGTDLARDPYPVLLASTAMGVMRAVMLTWARMGDAVEPSTLARAAFRSLREGLPPGSFGDLSQIGARPGEGALARTSLLHDQSEVHHQ